MNLEKLNLQAERKTLVDELTKYLDEKEAKLDAFIDSGTDHELFVASYIHGHYSVIAAQLLGAISVPDNHEVTLVQWQQQCQYMLNLSIDNAIENNELISKDANDVIAMRDDLFENTLEP
jgi:hypothetical protein